MLPEPQSSLLRQGQEEEGVEGEMEVVEKAEVVAEELLEEILFDLISQYIF